MGSIRMVMLDGLTVADLLALRQGGFFEGAVVQLPSTGASVTALPVSAPVAQVVPPVAVPPSPELTIEQAATLAQAQAELAEYRAEKGAPVAQETRTEPVPGIDTTVAPVAPVISSSGLPSVAQLANCTKLRDAMQLLLDAGMGAADLVPYLESVREQVPLLGRISNIPERVARTLSVMQQGG